MVLLDVPHAEQMVAYLKRHDIYTDSRRNQVVRMAPFLWNTSEDVDRTFRRIDKGLSTGAYQDVEVDTHGPVT
jgi:kynureninase